MLGTKVGGFSLWICIPITGLLTIITDHTCQHHPMSQLGEPQ